MRADPGLRVLAVTNMYPTPGGPGHGTFVEQQVRGLRRAGVHVDVLFLDRLQEGPGVYRALRPRLAAAVREHRSNLVHVMCGGVMADEATRSADLPTIVSFGGSDLLGEPFRNPARRISATWGTVASRRAARRAAGVIVKSDQLLAALPVGVDRHRVRLIPNGVDLDRFRPMDRRTCRRLLGWDDGEFHVLFASSSGSPVKRPALADAALAELRCLGVPARKQYLHGVPHEEVPFWMNAADALLVTSAHEGSPNVVKEALACDLPVVAVAVGDVPQRLAAVRGSHVAAADPAALAAKLAAVHARTEPPEGRAGVRDVDLTRISREIRHFYEEVLRSP